MIDVQLNEAGKSPIDFITKQVTDFLNSPTFAKSAAALPVAAASGDKIHSLVQATAQRTGIKLLKRLAECKPVGTARMLMTMIVLSGAPAPERQELFSMLGKSHAIGRQSVETKERDRVAYEDGEYDIEKEKLIAALSRGLKDLDVKLKEKLVEKKIDVESHEVKYALWRAKRVFVGDLIVDSQCPRVLHVLSLGEKVSTSADETMKIRDDFWKGIARALQLEEGEKLNLDDIAERERVSRAERNQSVEDFKASQEYGYFEEFLMEIYKMGEFDALRTLVGDTDGAMRDLEIGLLIERAPKAEQREALERLSKEPIKSLSLINHLNDRLNA